LLAAPPFNILAKLDRVDDAIDANADIASQMLKSGLDSFSLQLEPQEVARDWRNTARSTDIDKARTTLRQLYRDWSTEGRVERQACYDPVLHDLSSIYSGIDDKCLLKVLVPGAGLGRLVFEICKLGYTVEGNELSYHQLIASNWILNQTSSSKQYDLYPFALTFSNHVNRESQLKSVKVPDIDPGAELDSASTGMSTHAFERMTMTAADFLVLYGDTQHEKKYDAVITVFFLDTAPNVLRYIEVVQDCLRDGGYWINLGPLLWHFEERDAAKHKNKSGQHAGEDALDNLGIEEPGSVELTNDEILLLVESMGFTIEQHEVRNDGAGYIQDPDNMLQYTYRLSHWIARKSI
jgi:hypothetical protein